MTGHRSFKELTKGFSPERKARVAARVTQLKADMPLHELRQASIPIVRIALKSSGMPTPLPEFPATPPIGGAIKFSGGGVEGDLVVPSEVRPRRG